MEVHGVHATPSLGAVRLEHKGVPIVAHSFDVQHVRKTIRTMNPRVPAGRCHGLIAETEDSIISSDNVPCERYQRNPIRTPPKPESSAALQTRTSSRAPLRSTFAIQHGSSFSRVDFIHRASQNKTGPRRLHTPIIAGRGSDVHRALDSARTCLRHCRARFV